MKQRLSKCAVIDTSYSSYLGVGAQMLRDDLLQAKVDIVSPGDAQAIFAAVTHPLMAQKLERYRSLHVPIIAGGPGALSPSTISCYADAVVLGDYRRFVAKALADGVDEALSLPNIFVGGQTRQVEIDQTFPWDRRGYVAEDGKRQVWISRGCKHKCAFCQTGWSMDYQEHPNPAIAIADALIGGTLVSNALNEVSFASCLPSTGAASHTVSAAKRSLPNTRVVRFGVEGVSERLRKAVAKPISNDDLTDVTSYLMNVGKTVRWFMIAGLPYETKADWQEFRDVVSAVGMDAKNGVLQISFTAWSPDPATPLASMPLDDDYIERYKDFADWYFEVARRNRIAIFRCQSPFTRREKADAALGDGSARRVQYPHRHLLESYVDNYLRHMGRPNQRFHADRRELAG